jgi:hypothetical protein
MVSTIEVHWRELRFREEEIQDESPIPSKAVPFDMFAQIGTGGEVRIMEQEEFEIRAQLADVTEARAGIIKHARKEVEEKGITRPTRFGLTPKEFPVARGFRSRVVGFATVSALEPPPRRLAA